MPKKTNRVCKVCGEKYYFCPSCSTLSAADKYKIMFCSENCRDIFKVLSRYNVELISKQEAKENLSALDLSKRNQFQDNIKTDITNIMKAYKPKSYKKVEQEEILPMEQDENLAIESNVVVEESKEDTGDCTEAFTPVVAMEF